MTVTMRISATVAPSTDSSTFAPRRAGETATTRVSARATPASRNGAHDGGFGQAPTAVRNAVPKMPAAVDVTTA